MPEWWRLRVPADTGFVIRALLAFVIAMHVAYQLELETPYSAGTTVIIVAANARGAVLSKSLSRIVGSVAGVVASIVLIASFVQAAVLFVFMIALWLGDCAFISSLLRYFLNARPLPCSPIRPPCSRCNRRNACSNAHRITQSHCLWIACARSSCRIHR